LYINSNLLTLYPKRLFCCSVSHCCDFGAGTHGDLHTGQRIYHPESWPAVTQIQTFRRTQYCPIIFPGSQLLRR